MIPPENWNLCAIFLTLQYNAAIYENKEVNMESRKTARSQPVIILLVLTIMTACIPDTTQVPTPETSTTEPVAEPVDGWLDIYFTDPSAPHALDYEGGPDEALAAAIDAARLSVDVAVYNLDLWSVRNALLDAHARGVVVRVVAESDNLDGDEFQDLIEAGIEVLGDRREGLMHNKFVIIDRFEVWTGSMNFTTNGAYEDNNNLLHIRSSEIAEDYLVEFNEMFVDDLFGPDIRAVTPNPVVTVDGTLVEVFFSPDDGVQAHLVELLGSAQESIYFLAYSFTADPLGEAIRSRAAAGVTVAGVMEAEQVASNTGTEYDPFLQSGLDVLQDANEGLMHHKVIIIDERIVVTGSYNFSSSAEERNDENLLIIHSPEATRIFMDEFWRVYGRAQP
jgi:phosphatidylserine/phosphatidylglycerophosphate/cardiolipin synthase-like enzyme